MKTLCGIVACFLFITHLSAQDPAGWRYYYLPNYRPVNALHVIDNNTIVAAGGNETNDKIRTICRSEDGGANWQIIIDDLDSSWLKSMYFINAVTGFTAGYEGILLKTVDGGINWTRIRLTGNAANRSYNSIFFIDAQTGFLAGGNKTNDSIQTILKTTDGGNTWSILRDQPGSWLKAIYFTDANTGYAAGENGVALKTTNGGDTWTQMTLPGSAATRVFNSILFLDANTGLLGGGNEANDSIQTILKTTDAGSSWSIIKDEVAPWINAIHFINSTTGYAAGDDGTLLVSNDAGSSWNNVGVPDSVDGGFTHHRTVHFQNSDFGIAAGTFGKVIVYNAPASIAPLVQTGYATNTYTSGTTVTGTVNANGASCAVFFEYWSAAGDVITIPAEPDSASGNAVTQVSASLTGLTSNALYHFRAKAVSMYGTSYGALRQIFIGDNPIPNWDFELWNTATSFVPQGWVSVGNVTQKVSYDGSHAVGLKGGGGREFGAVFFGVPGDNGFFGGARFPARPDSLIAYFDYDIAAGDSALILLWFKRNGVFNSQQFYYITGSSAGSFQRMSFPITFNDSSFPDTVVIGFTSSDPISSAATDTSSYLAIDNISFSGTTLNVPNNGFENWYTDSVELPVSWAQNFDFPVSGVPANVLKTTDSQHGAFAVKLQSNGAGGGEVARIATGDDLPAFPVYQKHSSFNFYMKYFPDDNDTLDVTVSMYENGQTISFARLQIDTTVAEYTPFTVPLNYIPGSFPDSANISVRSGGSSSVVRNSMLYIDNLAFDGFYLNAGSTASKKELSWNIYPNPARNEVIVKGTVTKDETALLSVLNINGTTMSSQTFTLPNGNFQQSISIEHLPAGIYIVALQKSGTVQFRRLAVTK